VSAGGRGRRAALPPAGFRPEQRLRVDEDTLVVRFVPEIGRGPTRDFDFATLPVARNLQEAFARAFATRTRPSAGIRSTESAQHSWQHLSSFAGYLAGLLRPPQSPADLTQTQVLGWLQERSGHRTALKELGELKGFLRRVEEISAEFAAAMTQSHRRPQSQPTTSIYSRDEFRRILSAARFDVRQAAIRIRAGRDLLSRWRSGALDRERDRPEWERGSLLDHVDRHADVPRYATGQRLPQEWVSRLGSVTEHVTSLHLGADDVAAFAVLLTGLTGENPGTITTAPAAHHRPDGYTGAIASAIVELDKPRRMSRRHMDVVLASVPDWITAPQEGLLVEDDGDDLHSAFGVYLLLHDLAGPARRRLGSDLLFAWWAFSGGNRVGRGLRTTLTSELVRRWSQGRDLPADYRVKSPTSGELDDECPDEKPAQLAVTLNRMRRTFLELHQKPVAHVTRTLANDYLLRERGNITEYQQVVADVLEQEARKARTRSAPRVLSPAEIEQARTDPVGIAERHGLDPGTLRRMLAGELDTVMTACTGNTNSPYSPPGTPCQASFMLCLSCPCARALPHHLPVQLAVHDAVQAKQDTTTPLRWAQRFALPHAQLGDLLDRAGHTAVADARRNITADQRELVDRFLNRELDLS
jgi:hypothetical protein